MMTIYLGILAIGIIAVIIIFIKESSKSSHSSAVDLLNSLDVDESPAENQAVKTSSSDFLRRLNLEEEKNKNVNEIAKNTTQQTSEAELSKGLDKKSSEDSKPSSEI